MHACKISNHCSSAGSQRQINLPIQRLIRARAVHDLLDAFNSAEAGFKARTKRQATQPGRWKKKSGQGNKNKNSEKNKKYKNKKRGRLLQITPAIRNKVQVQTNDQ
eukprot:evm.model.NODE_53248_length_38388_cov_31.637205.5